jgi:hypothetical protein
MIFEGDEKFPKFLVCSSGKNAYRKKENSLIKRNKKGRQKFFY